MFTTVMSIFVVIMYDGRSVSGSLSLYTFVMSGFHEFVMGLYVSVRPHLPRNNEQRNGLYFQTVKN